jgi:hypothetical protein
MSFHESRSPNLSRAFFAGPYLARPRLACRDVFPKISAAPPQSLGSTLLRVDPQLFQLIDPCRSDLADSLIYRSMPTFAFDLAGLRD